MPELFDTKIAIFKDEEHSGNDEGKSLVQRIPSPKCSLNLEKHVLNFETKK